MNISSKEAAKRKLLGELLNRTAPVTVEDLAKLISKTGRTVRSYLDEMQEEYRDLGVAIVRKTNVGVYIAAEPGGKVELMNRLEKDKAESPHAGDFSSRYRQVYILRILFEDKFSYTIQMFADDLYCSKSTIVNELTYVQEWLERYNLTLRRKQNQGLWIEGNEKDFRRAFKVLIDEMQDKDEKPDNSGEIEVELDYRIDILDYTKVKNMFPKINVYTIQRIIQEAEKKLGFYFTDQAFLNLVIHSAITIERLKNHKAVSSHDNFFGDVAKEPEYVIAKWVVHELDKEFKVSFPDEEIGYISIHMLGAKIQENYDPGEYSMLIERYDVKFTAAAKSMIALSSEITAVDLSRDYSLLTRLVLHLRPTVMRLKYGLRLANPILDRIKREYFHLFGVAWACSSVLENTFGVKVNEDEVGYLALHLALAFENIKSKLRTVIVCSSGLGTSQLVACKLVKKFDNLEITHILPYHSLTSGIIDEADLIVTTIRTVRASEKVVYISTLVNEVDYHNIETAVKKLKRMQAAHAFSYTPRDDTPSCSNEEESIFENELCFLNSQIADFQEATQYYGLLMEEKGYAKHGFYEDILKREQTGSTYIGRGIAIPHAQDIFVNKSKVCVVKCSTPLTWQGNTLDLLFILCLKFKDIRTTKQFFKKLYALSESDDMVDKVRQAQCLENITTLFNWEEM